MLYCIYRKIVKLLKHVKDNLEYVNTATETGHMHLDLLIGPMHEEIILGNTKKIPIASFWFS